MKNNPGIGMNAAMVLLKQATDAYIARAELKGSISNRNGSNGDMNDSRTRLAQKPSSSSGQPILPQQQLYNSYRRIRSETDPPLEQHTKCYRDAYIGGVPLGMTAKAVVDIITQCLVAEKLSLKQYEKEDISSSTNNNSSSDSGSRRASSMIEKVWLSVKPSVSTTSGRALNTTYGFIEFRSKEECDVAQGLNQCVIEDVESGNNSFSWNVTISRPKSYIDPYRGGVSEGVPNYDVYPLASPTLPDFILLRENGRENNPLVKQAKEIFRIKVGKETAAKILANKKEAVKRNPKAPGDNGCYGDWLLKDYKCNILADAPVTQRFTYQEATDISTSKRLRLDGVLSRQEYDSIDVEERSEIITDVQDECKRVAGGEYSVNVMFDLNDTSSPFIPMVVTIAGRRVEYAVGKITASLHGRLFGGNRVSVSDFNY